MAFFAISPSQWTHGVSALLLCKYGDNVTEVLIVFVGKAERSGDGRNNGALINYEMDIYIKTQRPNVRRQARSLNHQIHG